MNKFIDLTGMTINGINVIKINRIISGKEGKRRGSINWEAKCSCGIIYFPTSQNIKNGTKCGICYVPTGKPNIGNRKTDPKLASLRGLINRYKQTAKRRKYEWMLSEQESIDFFTGNCYYCGIPPCNNYNVYRSKSGKFRSGCVNRLEQGHIITNGIDRVDNCIGYMLSNCVSCCKSCNYAKNELTRTQFLDLAKRIYENSCNIGYSWPT
jgi:hypothetical protein